MKEVVNIKGNVNNHLNSLLLAFAKYIYCDNFLIFCLLVLKLRLHYNELAQRTATVWRYLTFGDIRCYTLKKSDECDH